MFFKQFVPKKYHNLDIYNESILIEWAGILDTALLTDRENNMEVISYLYGHDLIKFQKLIVSHPMLDELYKNPSREFLKHF